jgi:glycosyltransferase involved in cell wall biosynthesis
LLVIGPEPPPETGMEVATRTLLVELRRAGIPYVRVDTADPGDRLGNRGRWTLRNVVQALRHLVDAVRKTFRRDVAAVYIPIAQEFPALFRDLTFVAVASVARKRVAVHLHGGAFGEFYESRRRLTRRLLRGVLGRAELGIVLTEGLRPALECVLEPARVAVVANGVDLPEGDGGESDGSLTAVFLSSLFPSKGVLVFVEALARARAVQPGLRGILAGAWPSREVEDEVAALVRWLSLDGALRIVGPVHGSEKTRLLQEAGIFCLPSSFPLEGQPLVVIEAMAAGLPVVATSWRGIPDTVVDGETGLLVPEPSPELVAEKLVYLAEHEDERRRMGAAGRRRYEELYTQHAFGERMVAVLRPLLEGSAR